MSPLFKDLMFVILQFLREENHIEAAHELERESGLFFDMNYLKELVMKEDWIEVDKYLGGFTKVGDNSHSNAMFFLIHKFRYLEALKRMNLKEAVEILIKDLKVFSKIYEELYKKLTILITLNDRENSGLTTHVSGEPGKAKLLKQLEHLIKKNPVFKDKLEFPSFQNSRLRTLITQSSKWEYLVHDFIRRRWSIPEIKNLFEDHTCGQPNLANTLSLYNPDYRPNTVVANLNQGSAVTSMDFHPLRHSLLLVGTNIGDISVWEVQSKERLEHRNFRVWELPARLATLQAASEQEYTASVNRVMWSPDGALFGVAYSKHIVHIYHYHIDANLQNHLEIDAHYGSVNDLTFAYPKAKLCVVTCGDDKTIKVWDAVTGSRLCNFKGHRAPVYSICAHHKGEKFITCTFVNGDVKVWYYDKGVYSDHQRNPGHACMTIAYTDDETRLFSCGRYNGEPYLAEWNQEDCSFKWEYVGLCKRSIGALQFDTARNKLLAVGDESSVKFWQMDYPNFLVTTDADGGLPASPCVRFNKLGAILLAVSTSDNGIKVLATAGP